MDSARVLLVGDPSGSVSRLQRIIVEEGFKLTTAAADGNLENLASNSDFDILVVLVLSGEESYTRLLDSVRKRFVGAPMQIIGVAGVETEYRRVLELGADDVISMSASDIEVAARLHAAGFRLGGQVRMLREREFFRQAVREEEAVNARILDRNRMLLDACRSLEGIKRELERSNEQLRKMARFDMLSGLLNRVALFSTMDMEIERAVRSGTVLSGFMTDIDNFKNINDNWGHPSGDRVIRMFGTRMTESLRKYDYAGRYGGEEFFVILPNAGIGRAEKIAERFRTKLNGEPISFGEDNLVVTASIGVAEFKRNEPRDSWVMRADQAMYLAKQQGRDRVCVLN